MKRADGKDSKAVLARRIARLRRVLVAGGMLLATGCAGPQKEGAGSPSKTSDTASPTRGGGAAGW